jgi:hypothetical protein
MPGRRLRSWRRRPAPRRHPRVYKPAQREKRGKIINARCGSPAAAHAVRCFGRHDGDAADMLGYIVPALFIARFHIEANSRSSGSVNSRSSQRWILLRVEQVIGQRRTPRFRAEVPTIGCRPVAGRRGPWRRTSMRSDSGWPGSWHGSIPPRPTSGDHRFAMASQHACPSTANAAIPGRNGNRPRPPIQLPQKYIPNGPNT